MRRLLGVLPLLIGSLWLGQAAGPPAVAAQLDSELKSEFFGFFHLEASCSPVAVGATSWHCFRPSGPAFRPLVELDVLTDREGAILESRLGLDRAFIDSSRNGIFARDLAKSYLAWAVANPPPAIAGLIANIGDVSQAGGRVIMRGDVKHPPPDTTGGYAVYLGKTPAIVLTAPGAAIALTNIAGVFPAEHIYAANATGAGPAGPRWLRIDVRPSSR